MDLDYSGIGKRIKESRKRRGLTQEQLAELIDSSREHISRIEAGERGISIETLLSIADELNVSISSLLVDASDREHLSELEKLLLDCTKKEENIITKTAKALRLQVPVSWCS